MRSISSTQAASSPTYPVLKHHHDDVWIDPATGQLFVVPRPRRRRRSNQRQEFSMVYLAADPLGPLLHSRSRVELAVFLYFVTSMRFRESFTVNRAAVGRRLGVSREAVSKAVRALVEYGALCADEADPTRYWVNPDVAHRGDEVDRKWVHDRSCCSRRWTA